MFDMSTKYFINSLIEYFNEWNKTEQHEIFLYKLSDFYTDLQYALNDFKYGNDDDDIKIRNDINENIRIVSNWLKCGYDDNVLIIDTPCDDDMIAFIKFDDKCNINGFFEIQTYCENIGGGFGDYDVSICSDVWQLINVIFNYSMDFNMDYHENIPFNILTDIFHKLYDYLVNIHFNWDYCFSPDETSQYYETSIFDNVDVFKRYYIELIYGNMNISDMDNTIKLFNILDMLKNNIWYIHYTDDDEIIIVCKPKHNKIKHCFDDVIYWYNIYTNKFEKLNNDQYNIINYVLECELNKL